jgi:hypothetical protein
MHFPSLALPRATFIYASSCVSSTKLDFQPLGGSRGRKSSRTGDVAIASGGSVRRWWRRPFNRFGLFRGLQRRDLATERKTKGAKRTFDFGFLSSLVATALRSSAMSTASELDHFCQDSRQDPLGPPIKLLVARRGEAQLGSTTAASGCGRRACILLPR